MLYSQKQRGLIDNLVGYPGKSDHQKGASLDIEEWADVKTLMTTHGWEWTYGNKDAIHFDCTSDEIRDIRPDSIKDKDVNILTIDRDLLDSTMNANTFGAIRMVQAFLPLLEKSLEEPSC
ncbi:hypothetical protein LC653_37965 [Nostoc sp. CHAB 5784]|uniref:hypothetical protein n=1 Tax=Nostoc mirabile TaxID=2907820 RepID=UPI001E475122|nr:hypothetical protein [Nostoc mirabile]MCC5669470.1 hypothetical protein [Nostoc mirabile CHAB5784]